MRSLLNGRHVLMVGLAAVLSAAAWTCPSPSVVGASTPAGTLFGEGGDAMTPVMIKLLHDDATALSPDVASYTNVNLEHGITDFIGSSPGTFGSDFAVTERPLTAAEAATAKANGRTFAYVPFVAGPVALMTLVPNACYNGSTTINPNQYCQNIPLSLENLDGIYGAETPQYSGWGDSRISCTNPPTAPTPADSLKFFRWANLDPTMENYALMSLLDSTTTSQASFAAGLTAATTAASTTDPTASEHWPYSGTALTGGDNATVGKLIGLDARTGAPSSVATQLTLGAIMPVASVWTGDPLGVRWNLPTAAVQNAEGAYVPPSTASAQAAEADATFTTTSDPTTSNLVTFNANATDASAYNNYLMLESYLVVPTSGLSADKALALAQFIRYAVGTKGQAAIEALGAAPATSAMVAADLTVAQQLDAEAAAAPPTTTTTTTTTAGSTTTTTVAGSGGAGTAGSSPSTSAGTAGSSSGGLAVTGSDPLPLVGLGVALLICGEVSRQVVRRRKGRA